jgi:orotate phosphoribosyltransferase
LVKTKDEMMGDLAGTSTNKKAKLLTMIRELSYEKRTITLASGRTSDFYIDMKHTLLHPQGIDYVSDLMAEGLKTMDGLLFGVGGLTMGADPLSTALSLKSLSWKQPLMAFYIRKEPKGHGTSQWVEGMKNFKPNNAVYILEDVVTSGGSSLKAVERAKLAGLNVKGVFTCVDRQEGGEAAIRAAGLELKSLFNKRDILGE